MARRGANPTGRRFDSLFDLAPRRVYLAGAISRNPGGLLPRLFTLAALARSRQFALRLASAPSLDIRGLFSVALSVTHGFHAPSALDKRILRPVESGLSSALRQRPVARASLQEKISKNGRTAISRGRGCARTSCTRRSSAACPPRHCARSHRRAGRRSAAARDGNRRTRRHG